MKEIRDCSDSGNSWIIKRLDDDKFAQIDFGYSCADINLMDYFYNKINSSGLNHFVHLQKKIVSVPWVQLKFAFWNVSKWILKLMVYILNKPNHLMQIIQYSSNLIICVRSL
jgi:hypothetical protein